MTSQNKKPRVQSKPSTTARAAAPRRRIIPQSGASVAQFRAIVQGFYDETFASFPERGSEAGLHAHDHALSKPTPALWEKQRARAYQAGREVEKLPATEFDPESMLDRRAFLAQMRQEHFEIEHARQWQTNPRQPLMAAADALHHLFIRHADNLSPVAEPMLARLKRIPAYLDAASECLESPDPHWQKLTQRDAEGVASFFDSLALPLTRATQAPTKRGASASATLETKPNARIAKLCSAAASSARALANHAAALQPARAGSYAIGEFALNALIQRQLGLPYTAVEVTAIALAAIESLRADLKKEARRFHPRKSASEILHDAAQAWEPGGDLLATYRSATAQMRALFEDGGLVSFPKGERLLVKPVPDFMRGQFPTAAYSAPGALDAHQTGIFWVNDLGAALGSGKKADAARRAEVAQHFGVELTSAHEAYPGHHLQFIIQNRHPSLARKMAHHAVYYEGWTLWCEQMVADHAGKAGIANPCLRLQQLSDALWRAWRVIIDVGLQVGWLTIPQAVAKLVDELGFTRARAQGEIDWYTSSPGIPMSYYLGKLEMLRLKQRKVDAGGQTLRQFNDWLLSFGAIPQRWIDESGL